MPADPVCVGPGRRRCDAVLVAVDMPAYPACVGSGNFSQCMHASLIRVAQMLIRVATS